MQSVRDRWFYCRHKDDHESDSAGFLTGGDRTRLHSKTLDVSSYTFSGSADTARYQMMALVHLLYITVTITHVNRTSSQASSINIQLVHRRIVTH